MNPEIKALIEKAKRGLKAASNLFKDGDIDFAPHVHITLFSTSLPRFCSHVTCHFQAILEQLPISGKNFPKLER